MINSGAYLVERTAELEKLMAIYQDTVSGKGHLVVIDGRKGIGKTKLVEALQARIEGLIESGSSHSSPLIFRGSCDPIKGIQSAFDPFDMAFESFSQSSAFGKLKHIFKETMSDWLGVIPGFGDLVGASVKTGMLLMDGEQSQIRQSNAINEYESFILNLARKRSVVLVIEDAHWIDNSSTQLLTHLQRKINDYPILIIITQRPISDKHHTLEILKSEVLDDSTSIIMTLQGFEESQISDYIQMRFDSNLSDNLPAWLHELCNGNPLFLAAYFGLLEERLVIQKINGGFALDGQITGTKSNWRVSGKLAEIGVPQTVEDAIEQRIKYLMDEEQELLRIGSVQGERFMSAILAGLLDTQESGVLSQLRKVAERHQIISSVVGESWLQNRSALYQFEHILMRNAFYEQLHPRERIIYHEKIAESLVQVFEETQQENLPLTLEIAYHYEHSGKLLGAVEFYYQAAYLMFYRGTLVETTLICKDALRLIREIQEKDKEQEKLHAQIINLMLASNRYRSQFVDNEFDEIAYSEEGEGAALRSGDRSLYAQLKYRKGILVLISDNVPDGLALMSEAREIAHNANDPVTEFAIMTGLGGNTNKENLEKGMKILYEAKDLYNNKLKALAAPNLEYHLHKLQTAIGVGEFDRGNMALAETWLLAAIDGLESLSINIDLLSNYNYIGQLYMTVGYYENAEDYLNKSFELLTDDDVNAWNGYNLALLGKVYIEWGRINNAEQLMIEGVRESELTRQIDLITLVRNYYSELLMHPSYEHQNLEYAEEVLKLNLKESKQSSMHRSTIAALSLLGQLSLTQGHIDALGYSTEAVELLETLGTMPALRSEEVFFNHYRVLKKAQLESQALEYLNKANDVLQEKAANIKDRTMKKSFFERVPLSKAILEEIAHYDEKRKIN